MGSRTVQDVPALNPDGSRTVGERILRMRKKVFENIVDGGESMKVDGSAGSLDEGVWNGDDSYWSDPSIGSKTTGSKRTGTYGWDTGATSLNDEVKFTRSSAFQPSSDAIEGWINLQALPATCEIQARWELSNVAKGNGVLVTDYLETQDLGVWQFFSIPLSDFNLPAENVDEFRFRTRQVAGADYWLDDIRLVSGGGAKRFRVAPGGSAQWLLGNVTLVLVAADTGWANDAFCNIAGGLADGLVLRHRDEAESNNFWRVLCKKNLQLFGQFDPVVDTAYDDSTRQISFVLNPWPASVVITANDVLEWVVKDDLTSLVDIRAFAQVGVIIDE